MYQYPLQDDADRIPSIYINIKAGDWLIPSTDGRKFIGEGLTKRKKKKKKKRRSVDIFGWRIVLFLWSIHTNNTCVIVVAASFRITKAIERCYLKGAVCE